MPTTRSIERRQLLGRGARRLAAVEPRFDVAAARAEREDVRNVDRFGCTGCWYPAARAWSAFEPVAARVRLAESAHTEEGDEHEQRGDARNAKSSFVRTLAGKRATALTSGLSARLGHAARPDWRPLAPAMLHAFLTTF